MKRAGLRRFCERVVAGLDVPAPFDVHDFCARLADRRGRPIVLLASALPPESVCGMWVSAASADYIFYEQQTSRLHQEHIILHEVGHVLCDHTADQVLSADTARLLMPSLDPAMVQRMLGRTQYSAEEEQQAEIVASLILQQANRSSPDRHREPPAEVPAEMADAVDRLARSLGQPDAYGPRTPWDARG
jgi:hypothetical protein